VGVSPGALAKVLARLEAVEAARVNAAMRRASMLEQLEGGGGSGGESSSADAPAGAPPLGLVGGGDAPSGAPIKGTSGDATVTGGKKRWGDKVWQPGSGGTMAGWISYPWGAATQGKRSKTFKAPPAPSSSGPEADAAFPCEVGGCTAVQFSLQLFNSALPTALGNRLVW
jgi:hypothetical protein